MSIDISQFNEVFFDESQEHLNDMEQLLMELDPESPEAEALNSIFRAAHSIKGGSDIFGFKALTGLTHVMENLLDKARKNTIKLSVTLIDLLLDMVDVLKSILTNYRNNEDIDWELVGASTRRLEDAVSDTNTEAIETSDDGFGFFETIEPQDDDEAFGFFDDTPSSTSLDDDGFGFFNTAESIPKNNVDVNSSVETPSLSTPVVQSKEPTQASKKPSQASKRSESTTSENSSIRVDTIKVDKLVNLVGELVITQSMLNMIDEDMDTAVSERLQLALGELERNTKEIQEAVMSIRMLPISFVFSRFPRLVRDLSSKLDKQIDLVIEGGTTEIDKGLIEKLADPLTHLIRNSIDHGVETPELREQKGKNAAGKIILKAQQKGSSILISIIDDGAGLNRERILAKAIENGMDIDPNMKDADVWRLIFAAGFSTAAEVTDVSGRGVGMDVVRRNIEALGGRIEIESKQDIGTTFDIHLPLTLAIVDGMTVEVSGEIFVVPLVNIVESLQPSPSDLRLIGGDTLIWIREEYWPIISLASAMDLESDVKTPSDGIVVLLESAKKRFGLLVDNLVGQQQVVIKSLERHFHRVDGVAGATIMGDGSVAMILDVESLSNSVKKPVNLSKVD